MGARHNFLNICLLFLHKAVTAPGICVTLNDASTEFQISCYPGPREYSIVVHNVIHGYMYPSQGSTCASQDEFQCQQMDYQDDLYWKCNGKRQCTGVLSPQTLTNCQIAKSIITLDSTHVFLDFECVPRPDFIDICHTHSLSKHGQIYIQSPSLSRQTAVSDPPTFSAQNIPGTLDPALSSITICRCQISGPVYTQVELRTMNFALSLGEPECPDEHVIIGNPANSLSSGKLCGNKYDKLWKATDHLMELEYFVRTDIGYASRGFLLEVRAVGYPGNAQIKVSCGHSQLTTTSSNISSSSSDSSSTSSTSTSTSISVNTSTSLSTSNQSEAPVAAIAGGVVAVIAVVAVIIAVIAFILFRRKKSNVYEEPEKPNPDPRIMDPVDPVMKDNLAYVATEMNPSRFSPSRNTVKNGGEEEENFYEDIPIPTRFKDEKTQPTTAYVNEKSQYLPHNNVSNDKPEEPVPKRMIKGRTNAYTWPPNQDSVKEVPVYLSLIGD